MVSLVNLVLDFTLHLLSEIQYMLYQKRLVSQLINGLQMEPDHSKFPKLLIKNLNVELKLPLI